MDENPIEAWFQEDSRVLDILNDLDHKALSEKEAAKEAFYRIAELCSLPKFPDEVVMSEEDEEEPRSVFVELALVRAAFCDDENEYIAPLIRALYNVRHKQYIPFDAAAARHFGGSKKIPPRYYAHFYGRDVDACVKFDIESRLAQEPDCRMMVTVF